MAETFDIKSEFLEECRFCGASLDCEVFDIFSILLDTLRNSSKSMYEAFEIATGIQISPEDSTIRSVCGTCYTHLQTIMNVRRKAKDSYSRLIAYRQKIKATRKSANVVVNLAENNCLVCFETKCNLTEISVSASFNAVQSLRKMYESVIGISVPDDTTFLCDTCIESLQESTRFRVSSKNIKKLRKSVENMFSCRYCGKRFYTFKACKLHLQTHQNLRQNVCNICYKAFITQEHLIKHIKKHSIEIQYRCTICRVEFQDSVSLKNHSPCNAGETVKIESTLKTSDTGEIESTLKTSDTGEIDSESTLKTSDTGKIDFESTLKTSDNEKIDSESTLKTSDTEKIDSKEGLTFLGQIDETKCFSGSICDKFKGYEKDCRITRSQSKSQNVTKFYCRRCKKVYLNENLFYLHMDTHITDHYFFCKVCFKEFDNISAYECHALIQHSKDICRKCTFMSKTKISLNLVKPNPKRVDILYICEICSKHLNTLNGYRMHMRRIHDICSNFVCNDCRKSYKSRINYIKHMQDVHNAIPPEFKSLSQISKNHMRIHRNDNQNTCKICLKQFRRISTFLEHTEREHPNNICKICSKVFKNVGLLSKHLERHSKIQKNLCNICAKLFSSTKKYRRHRRAKHKVYWCHICNDARVYIDRKKFTKHMNIHINEKYYICRICFKEFEEVESYRAHVKNHKKKLICTLCTYTTQFFGTMSEHSSRHFGNRSYLCKICLKRFYTQRDLNHHITRHKIGRPWECDICGLKFAHLSNIYRHKYSVHKILKCKICLKSFPGRNEFTEHIFQTINVGFICKADTKRCLCKVCLEDFETTELCEAHLKSEHERYICKICSQVLLYPAGMRRHLRAKHS